MMSKDDIILYIEDNDFSREQVLASFVEEGIPNVVAPKTALECQELLSTHKNIYAAIIDYKLSDWVGQNYERPLVVNDNEINHGLQIATDLQERKPGMPIGMFSANHQALKVVFEQMEEKDNIALIKLNEGDFLQRRKKLPDFAKSLFDVEVYIRPFHDQLLTLPRPVLSFFARRLMKATNKGNYLWKAGRFAWQVAVNSPLEVIHEYELPDVYKNKGNAILKFNIRIDTKEFRPISFYRNERNLEISIENYFAADMVKLNLSTINPVSQMMLADLAFHELAMKRSSEAELADRLSRLGAFARLYGQKSFLRWAVGNEMPSNLHHLPNLPRIHSIQEGRVDKVFGDDAYVQLRKISLEKESETEILSFSLLNESGIEENSRFEFTIHDSSEGGCSYHFEPL